MTIFNRSKVRPDILKLMDERQKIQMKAVVEFLKLEENRGINLQAIMKKVGEENERFFRRAAANEGTIEDLYGILTDEEMLFLAKLFRFVIGFSADITLKNYPISDDIKIEEIDIEGIPTEWQIVPSASEERVLLYFHGGGMVLGSPKDSRTLTVALGEATKMRVLSVDYRLAPEYPYPASLEDCTKVYNWLLSTGIKPKNIVIAGLSAGGNLTLATLVKLRDDGTPLPAGAVSMSPGIDYTTNSKTLYENAETDPVLADIGIFWWGPAFLAGADPNNPLISTVFADLKDLPPILIQASKIEILYDHSTRFFERAKAAGVDITLQEWDDMIHGFQIFGFHELPEAKEAVTMIGEFVQKLFK